MYPWFAMGHLIPFLQLSNKLAKKGHQISLIIPKNTHSKLHQFNLFPHLITFIPITLPHYEGLPQNAETTADIPRHSIPLLMTAMDRTEKDIEQLLLQLNPHIVFFDFTEWLPDLARKLGIKSLQYMIGNPATAAYLGSTQADAIGFKGSREIEGPFVDHLANQFGKPVLLSGPAIPDPPSSSSELLLGLELTGFPFLAALRPPSGFESVESAMPGGFQERVGERGMVHGGWVQQQEILGHTSVGCFITHCGVDLDQSINARTMSSYLKVGVEVEKGEEDGLFTRESVCKAVRSVMDEESEIGKEIRENHNRFRSYLLSKDLESSCVDSFCNEIRELLK
ncbi:UDP-glycosyltransferase 79B30-like [Senna tora]|uniref:UDP-glycosyltransferase 79B30-like n=1 Tax=Senna tora TaxID=362788 RepID=A0A834TL71_9FABA|nr:UDP-glycosyltransferase 79B30-like [Senna tora]